MIDKIRQEGKIDIYNFVVQMRRERSLMVQTVVCLTRKISLHKSRNSLLETVYVHLSIVIGILSLW